MHFGGEAVLLLDINSLFAKLVIWSKCSPSVMVQWTSTSISHKHLPLKAFQNEAFELRGTNGPATGMCLSIPTHKITYWHTKVTLFHFWNVTVELMGTVQTESHFLKCQTEDTFFYLKKMLSSVSLSHVELFCNPMDCSLPGSSLPMGFPRQEYWSGLPFPSPGNLPDPGTKPVSPALTGSFNAEPPGQPLLIPRSW